MRFGSGRARDQTTRASGPETSRIRPKDADTGRYVNALHPLHVGRAVEMPIPLLDQALSFDTLTLRSASR